MTPLDPICGMTVEADSPLKYDWNSETYFFCGEHCLELFQKDPAAALRGEAVGAIVEIPESGYYCPMCPGIRSESPGLCPKCGMALESAGLTRKEIQLETRTQYVLLRQVQWSMALALPLMASHLMGSHHVTLSGALGLEPSRWIEGLLATAIVLGPARWIFEVAFQSFARRSLNMFSLIGVGALAALGSGEFEAAGMILSFTLLGQWIEARARKETRSAVEELVSLLPDSTQRQTPTGVETVSAHDLRVGDRVYVVPGTRVPRDGVLTSESAGDFDERILTGESDPVVRHGGLPVPGGALLIGPQAVWVEIRAERGKSTPDRVIQSILRAQADRPKLQERADRVAAIFTPAVIGIAILAALVTGLKVGIAILVVACPCALGLATPLSVAVGLGRLGRGGILVRNPRALDVISSCTEIAFDKTGTLTRGMLNVVAHAFPESTPEADRAETLHLLRALTQPSAHPVAQAIFRFASASAVNPPPVLESSMFSEIPGQGLRAQMGGKLVFLGSAAAARAQAFRPNPELESWLAGRSSEPESLSVLLINQRPRLALALRDELRSDAAGLVAKFTSIGMRPALLSGDRDGVAQSVGAAVGIEPKRVLGAQTPEQKREWILERQRAGARVLMVGDGINDAPALAQADVGVAIGDGSAVAGASADFVLLAPELSRIRELQIFAREISKNISVNLVLAFGYNIVAIPLAWTGGISPMFASLMMTGSSLAVTLNALRLRWVRIGAACLALSFGGSALAAEPIVVGPKKKVAPSEAAGFKRTLDDEFAPSGQTQPRAVSAPTDRKPIPLKGDRLTHFKTCGKPKAWLPPQTAWEKAPLWQYEYLDEDEIRCVVKINFDGDRITRRDLGEGCVLHPNDACRKN